MSVYEYKVEDISGHEVPLKDYEGKVLLIVNTASKCGFTPQFEDLETLYNEIGSEQFEILGFPCNQFAKQEPGSNTEIIEFCKLNYKVTFPMFSKIKVNGKYAHPLYQYLTKQAGGLFGKSIKWNFTKFLVDQNGEVVKRFPPSTNPLKIKEDIMNLINQN